MLFQQILRHLGYPPSQEKLLDEQHNLYIYMPFIKTLSQHLNLFELQYVDALLYHRTNSFDEFSIPNIISFVIDV